MTLELGLYIFSALVVLGLFTAKVYVSRHNDPRIRNLQIIAAISALTLVTLFSIVMGVLYFTGYFNSASKIFGGLTAMGLMAVGFLYDKSPGSVLMDFYESARRRDADIGHWIRISTKNKKDIECKVKRFRFIGVKCMGWDHETINFGLKTWLSSTIFNISAEAVRRERTKFVVSRKLKYGDVKGIIEEALVEHSLHVYTYTNVFNEKFDYKAKMTTHDLDYYGREIPWGFRVYEVFTYHPSKAKDSDKYGDDGVQEAWEAVRQFKKTVNQALDEQPEACLIPRG